MAGAGNFAFEPDDPLDEVLANVRQRFEDGAQGVAVEEIGGSYRICNVPDWVTQFVRRGEQVSYVVTEE